MDFELVGPITQTETIAAGRGIGELAQLKKKYGGKNWRKRKGVARVRLENGILAEAELHWYECHGVGKRKMKIKRVLRRL